MSDFLLELFSEEIPARMQAEARRDLERLFRAQLDEAGLSAESVTTYSTPRRLALIASGLPAHTEAVSEEAKGPPEGAPDAAVDGFCRKQGVTRDQLEVRDVKGRATYFAVVDKPGQKTADVLAPAIAEIVREFPWPKSMRWGAASMSSSSLRWVRPLHRIVAMLDEEIVPVEIEGVSCGAASLGHRFHHPGEITFAGASDYVEKLRMAHVLIDHEQREAIVREGAAKAAKGAGYELIEDEGLVVENAGLTEWPVPLLSTFDEDFLNVPEEVIQLTARADQKYFVMRGKGGRLAPAFVLTSNIESSDTEAVIAGNRRVLAARLNDARFFWENDLKVPLESLSGKLRDIVFHEKLGTVADKVERVAKLARWLVEEGIVGRTLSPAGRGKSEVAQASSNSAVSPRPIPLPAEEREKLAAQVERAARLAKNDLVTGMVGEFPELQGVIGGHLARAQGEDAAVAEAVRDHYKPVGQSDEVPTAPVTVAVSLADKLDSLRQFFQIDEKPTGSKDPFALRRAALGAIRLVTENDLRLALAAGDLLEFFADRLKVQQKETGVRHDLIDAVFALGGEDDLVRLLARVTALQAFMETEDGANLHAAYKRTANILKKEGYEGAGEVPGDLVEDGEEDPLALVDEGQGSAAAALGDGDLEPAERVLADALVKAAPVAAQALGDENFTKAMEALASLRAPIDAFFDEVIVNADDAEVRARRLALLARFRRAVEQVADFDRIGG